MFDFSDIDMLGQPPVLPQAKSFLERAKLALDFAYQPIVEIHNGTVYGYEALMRGHENLGLGSIFEVLDQAAKLDVLHRFDMIMRVKAISKFAMLPRAQRMKLFYNLDNRIISSPDYFTGGTKRILRANGLSPASLCLEISERHEVSMKLAEENLIRVRGEEYFTAIDDFGAGYSGLKLLQEYQPDLLKIDRSLVSNIDKDKKCKLMVSTITDLAHILGIFVVAEGVETEAELAVCKEIGCDLVQGYLIERPQTDISQLPENYPDVAQVGRRHSKAEGEDARFIYEQIEYRPSLKITDSMDIVFEAFRRNKDLTFFPVIDEAGSPLGVVRETTLKDYTYSPFGKDLIANRGTGLNLRRFITPCPVADIRSNAQSILETFSMSESPDGIILVREFGYLGFLSTASLLRVINEKNLAHARDCSPLTKLPGNSSIAEYVNQAWTDVSDEENRLLVYLDLDNFKAFNDAYGFRQGDRAILLFAELMRKTFEGEKAFLAHVGGDDFFLGLSDVDELESIVRIEGLLSKFKEDVESFYSPEARERGCLKGVGRDGTERCFPLMTCSAAVLFLPASEKTETPDFDALDLAIAETKHKAKKSDSHIAVYRF